ncbi:enoyl-CoA hydratase/isomerase family protein [Nocardioides fonticola]|uniref:Enoyl-CoA hydratase/isomerase family protein n=1 Tax=Nocardioides fonticola TaxID=450363 RepID=A0ABP7XUP8_9ACTN
MSVDYAYDGTVASIHLARPHRLNAVDTELTRGLVTALQRSLDDGARAVVLAGRGRAFCAGHDLKEPPAVETVLETRARLEEIQEVTRLIRRSPAPVIAAVHGYALGAGCEFALACDVVVADPGATFGFPEVSVGLSVTGGISRFLPALVGWAKAKELLLLGEYVGAEQAHALGMIARVAPAEGHEELAHELARTIAARPPLAVSLAKQVLDQGLDASVEEAMGREVDHAVLTSLSGEGAAALEAFTRA